MRVALGLFGLALSLLCSGPAQAQATLPATFETFGGNEWWVEVYVTADEPVVLVEARTNGGMWTALEPQSWGSWASSYFVADNSHIEFRAHGLSGAVALSEAYVWPDGTLVGAGPSEPLSASFSTPGGNAWWVEVYVDANKPVAGVDARVEDGDWQPLEFFDWGAWAASFFVPADSRVQFRARSLDGEIVLSALFLWPDGTLVTNAIGQTLTTPVTPMELPVEIEIELSPAGSLKQVALWKELYQLLEDPYAVTCADPDDPSTCVSTIERRPGFGTELPPLKVFPLGYNFLTGQPLRLRTSDGEVSWDQPGPLFDPHEVVETDELNTPLATRTVIGHIVACPDDGAYQAADIPVELCADAPEGSLVVYNPDASVDIPPNGTVIAVQAFFDGMLHELDPDTGELEPITELEAPINEEDFFREEEDVAGVAEPLQPFIGRHGAEVLGKALFWDMQVGSDGVQACASCHFHAGVDNRTRGQLNPGTLAGDLTELTVAGPNEDVIAADFPFHKRVDADVVGDGTDPNVVVSDSNDVMSSMGVSRFKHFVDIPVGADAFSEPYDGVLALMPDLGEEAPDPVLANEGFRRVEERHTPTFHGAAFNFDNFWDGRARFNFNGGSVFGPTDPQFHLFIGDDGALVGATNGHLRPDLLLEDPEVAEQPVRVAFSSLSSQAVGPPLSDFEMSFAGRNWPKIGKKLLAAGVTPLANQLVAIDDSRLGPFSNQGGSVCVALGRATAPDKPGLCVSYAELIEVAFRPDFWAVDDWRLDGAPCDDPFDQYCLTVTAGVASPTDTNQFAHKEANFSFFFGQAVQAYETLTIPDDTPADRFFDQNPFAGHGVGEPGDQAVLFPTLVPDLLDDGQLNDSAVAPTTGVLSLIPDDPTTPEYDGFGPDEVFGFDIFAGANLTAALPAGSPRNPIHTIVTESGEQLQIAVGSNPFTRSAKCMLCHLGPEQTDHSINVAHGVLKNDAEFEYPTPPIATDPSTPSVFLDGLLPAPEPGGGSRTVPGLILAEEVGEGPAQDAVEVEPRNFATIDDPATPWDDRVVAQPGNFAFGDQGIYNIGLRPSAEDLGRGGQDDFGWPLSLAAMTLKNFGGADFEPCDQASDVCPMESFDPTNLGAHFEETGNGAVYPETTYTLQSINPGYERDPISPLLPGYLAPWTHALPAGELHPQIDELAGMVPNTVTPPNGGPAIEFPEVLFGADVHCALYDPVQFGFGPPNYGWGSPLQDGTGTPSVCPQNQSGVAGNMSYPVHGTWPVPNRVIRDGTFKAPALRNVELTGPYFHTGSYLTLRQVVDFYVRGGDFPTTNAEERDPNINDLMAQSFSFGRTNGADLEAIVNYGILQGYFIDGLPDTVFRYDAMPDTDHPITPEYATPEDAKVALVKFLLSLTDPRVRYERAPFDHPEIFVPVDGAAPENTGGRNQLLAQTDAPCPIEGATGICFKRIEAVGERGRATALPGFLDVTSNPDADCVTEISHFCR